jgi:hypothetical protein
MTPQFTFGSSSNITLPTPSTISPQTSMFNAFSSPFGSAQQVPTHATSKPLFGKEEQKVEEAKGEEEEQEEGEEEEEGEMAEDTN